MSNNPVFVRGLSRSGGTFLCTMLDAHPQLAISYELYPNMLQLEDDEITRSEKLNVFSQALRACNSIKNIPAEAYPGPKYRVFFIRLERGGLSYQEACTLFEEALEQQISFVTLEECCRFVEMCCTLKMRKERKLRWGAKMNNRIDLYIKQWPKVKCIDIVRDGRDVAASQIQLGTFGKTAEQIATAWTHTHRRFLDFQESHPDNIKVIKYENLLFDSERYIREMCDFLKIDYSNTMLNYHKENLTLFDAKHISKKNIMTGINTNSVGKWKKILSKQDVDEFQNVAGDLLEYFQY